MTFFRMKKLGRLICTSYLGLMANATSYAVDTMTYSENEMSFEQMLSKREELARRPASTFISTARVIGVRRELSLSESEDAQIPQDIILNGGVEKGLVKGAVAKVRRKIPILDAFSGNDQRELEVDFATIEVIHSQSGLSVARVKEYFPINSVAGLGTHAILVGDYIGN